LKFGNGRIFDHSPEFQKILFSNSFLGWLLDLAPYKKSQVTLWEYLSKFDFEKKSCPVLSISSYRTKNPYYLWDEKNFTILLFLNYKRGRWNLINDPINTVVLWLFLEILFLKVESKTSLGMTWNRKNREKFSTFWSFSIPCHSTQMNTIRIILGCFWFNSSWFFRYSIFQVFSSWQFEPSFE